MQVKSAPGTQCPMEANPKAYIGDDAAVEVPDTAYYRRLVSDGSLVPDPSDQSEPSDPSEGSQPKGGSPK